MGPSPPPPLQSEGLPSCILVVELLLKMFETPRQTRHSLKVLPHLKSSPSPHVAGAPTQTKLLFWA